MVELKRERDLVEARRHGGFPLRKVIRRCKFDDIGGTSPKTHLAGPRQIEQLCG